MSPTFDGPRPAILLGGLLSRAPIAIEVVADLTQVQLAERLGVPQSFVSKYESGERRLELPEIDCICNAIGIPLGDFMRRYVKA